jgi:hypothetical protein
MRSSPQSILVVEADRPLFRIAELVAPRASLRAKAIHNIACIDPCGSLDGDQDILNVSIQVGISKPCTDNIIYLGGITFGRARTRNWTSLNTLFSVRHAFGQEVFDRVYVPHVIEFTPAQEIVSLVLNIVDEECEAMIGDSARSKALKHRKIRVRFGCVGYNQNLVPDDQLSLRTQLLGSTLMDPGVPGVEALAA